MCKAGGNSDIGLVICKSVCIWHEGDTGVFRVICKSVCVRQGVTVIKEG